VTLTLNATPNPAALWWDDRDGIGIRLSYENDEIESDKILNIVFEDAVSLTGIFIADLFVEHGYIETGFYRVNDGSWLGFDAASLPGTGTNGEHAILFETAIEEVTVLAFRAPGKVNDGEDHEFALMGLDVSRATEAIPEPTAALLFGAGLLIASRAASRRK
jgi:hypothetical protein